MKDTDNKVTADRRSFLKLIGAGAVTGGAVISASAAASASEGDKDRSGSYRETQHIKTYYDLARF